MIAIIKILEESGADPRQKLTQLISLAVNSEPALGQAIRAWSFNDPKVKQAVDDVDARCMDYLQQLLGEMGIDEEAAMIRSRLIYSGYVGQVMLGKSLSLREQDTLIAELVTMATQRG